LEKREKRHESGSALRENANSEPHCDKSAVLWIRDVYPGSDFFHLGSRVDKIPDPDLHQRESIFNLKMKKLIFSIPDPNFSILDPGSEYKKLSILTQKNKSF
jgi:hypothetical protein